MNFNFLIRSLLVDHRPQWEHVTGFYVRLRLFDNDLNTSTFLSFYID